DAAVAVQSVMRNLMSKPPALAGIRTDISGVEEERVHDALDRINANHRNGNGSRNPYDSFKNAIKGASQKRNGNGSSGRGNADLGFLDNVRRMKDD
ncbi:MAG: hypothetical protein ACR2N0_16400, partial [Rubrobacteraceae bacterium]